jgi:oxalate decarboxylase/phosphoglucose isomerase-like protein (cupin superfamily)
LSIINATKLNGGTVKIVDSSTFKVSTKIAVADVTVEPGALRELHVSISVSLTSEANFCVIKWHPTQDEWLYVL